MKKLLIVVLAVAIILSVFAGCAKKDDSNMLTIELEGNPTTGFNWIYEMDREGIVREVSNEFVQDEAKDGEVGVGGKFVFTFEGVGEGTVNIDFVCVREWEDKAAEQEIIYAVTVDKDGKIVESKVK